MLGRTCLRSCPRILFLVVLALTTLLPAIVRAGTPSCQGRPATYVGTAGPDVFRGTGGDDVFVGRGGDDRLIGRGGADLFCAGGGNDVVKGGGGDDSIRGQGGSDRLLGGPGDDALLGGGGDDVIDGGDGADVVSGGPGTDECVGETTSACEGPDTEFEVDGSWTGTTSQDKDISFEVAGHELTTISIAYGWTGPDCTSDTEATINFPNGHPIEGNSFHVTGSIHDLVIDGTFTSDSEASGTFSASDPGGFCPGSVEGTWAAAKQ